MPVGILKARVGQDNGFVFERGHQRQEDLVRDVGGVPCPTDDLASVVKQPAQLHADDPAPVALAFLADLTGRALFSDRMDEFNPIAVNDGEESRLCQKLLTPAVMGMQGTLQTGAVRQASEQGVVIPFQPAIERPKVAAFEREQQPDGDQFARIRA